MKFMAKNIEPFLLLIFCAANAYGQGIIKSPVSDSLSSELPAVTARNKKPLTYQAKSQAEEINKEFSSNTIKNVVAGEKLQDMPDENIPVALSRLPGVSIMYNSVPFPFGFQEIGITGPGPYMQYIPQSDFTLPEDPVARVLIRGLDSRYYNVSINGMRIPPTSAKDNGVDLNIISGRDFQNIEVHKTITSDEDADATAGTINMVEEKAPYRRMIKVEALGNYNRLDTSGSQYNFTGVYGERFFNNKLGVLADAHIEKKIMSNESQNTSDNFLYFNSSYTNAVRSSNGADILLDYVTPDGGSITFHNIFNKTNTDNFISETGVSLVDPYLEPALNFTGRETKQEIFLSSLGGSNQVFGFDVDWNAAFSESRDNHPYNYILNFENYNESINFNHAFDIPTKNYSKEKTVSLDIHKKYALSNEITGELKLGGKYRINSRSYIEDSHLVRAQSQPRLSYFQDSPVVERIGLGNYLIPLINKDSLRSWRRSTLSQYDTSNGADINSYDLSQRISAGYIMHTFNFRGFVKFITGLRIENERNDYSGYYYPYDIRGVYPRPDHTPLIISQTILYNTLPEQTRTFHYNKTTILPNFQMILKPTVYLNMRLAAYKTLIRPSCAARKPKYFAISTYGNAGLTYLNMGNPDLKNADVWNYEFQLQFHGNDIGQFAIDAFYKEIEGMVQATNGMEMADSNDVKSLGIDVHNYVGQFPLTPAYVLGIKVFNLFSYYNSPKPTRIWGFEVAHQANFRYLPGLLKNIVLNYNFTFLRSELWSKYLSTITSRFTKITQSTLADKSGKLSDMPEFLANVNLGYDIDGFSFRISYFYQDGYPMYDNSFIVYRTPGLTEVKRNKYSRLDIAVRQRILKHIFINLNLNNINNFKEEALIKYPPGSFLPHENWETAQAYRYGMNIDFGVGIEL